MLSREKQWLLIEKLAAENGIRADTLRKWRDRGVPGKLRLGYARKAAAQGIAIDEDVFENPPSRAECEAA